MTTNEATRAYAAVAAKHIGLKMDEIDQIVEEMAYLMDIYTETEIMDKMRNLIGQEDR
ncbi:hypothetical protein [Holdemania sp. Marseille-P2844]|uniref:hypothetical protein n=1 Tax=Holdemania sp. Marseille-P2844 TaxID=1852366 RepID=UPI000A8686D3|nr:hypothetical protein [Holdemania sp. Marseille-P2844]